MSRFQSTRMTAVESEGNTHFLSVKETIKDRELSVGDVLLRFLFNITEGKSCTE